MGEVSLHVAFMMFDTSTREDAGYKRLQDHPADPSDSHQSCQILVEMGSKWQKSHARVGEWILGRHAEIFILQ